MPDEPPPTSWPAGWYSDPSGTGNQRFWDGHEWTEHWSLAGTTAAAKSEHPVGWRAFWNRGGLGRVVLLTLLVAGAVVVASVSVPSILYDRVDPYNELVTAQSVLFGLALPPVLLSVMVVVFVVSVGWFRRLFGPQPIGGRWWMWIAPALVTTTAVAVLASNDYTLYSKSVVASLVVTAVFVGFSEELVCRGLMVELLRASGHSEWVVMAISSLTFALLHALNIGGDGAVRGAVTTMLFALPFGVCLYLTLRVTGNLIWPIVIHALWDTAGFLANGWSGEPGNALLDLAALATVLAVGIIGLVFVRGRVRLVATPER